LNSTLKSLLFWMVLIVVGVLIWNFSTTFQRAESPMAFSEFLSRLALRTGAPYQPEALSQGWSRGKGNACGARREEAPRPRTPQELAPRLIGRALATYSYAFSNAFKCATA